jgi:hypothetical protein
VKKNNIKNDKDKISLAYNLKIEELDSKNDNKKENDFILKDYHWTNLSEQKVKVKEIEDKVK